MYRSSLVLVVAMVALAGCATMGRQVETDSGDLAMDIERARQDTARARAAYDTLKGQRQAVDARTIAFEDSLMRAREAAAAAAAAARDSAQRVAAAAVTSPEPGAGSAASNPRSGHFSTIYFTTNRPPTIGARMRGKRSYSQATPALTLPLRHADARGAGLTTIASYDRRRSAILSS